MTISDSGTVSSGSSGPRPRWRRISGRILLGVPVFFALSQILIWTVWKPKWADSEKNVVTIAQVILGTLCLLTWWFFCSPVAWRTRLAGGGVILGALLAWGLSIRSVELSGDMVPLIEYRWQPSAEQKFAAYHAQQQVIATGKPGIVEIPVIQPEEMPAYRGIHRDGIVIGSPVRTDWKSDPPVEIWRHPVGGGYASMAVVGSLLVTLEQRGKDEAVVCYDAVSGLEHWSFPYPADFFEAMGGAGPRSTPTISGDAVFAFGAFGDLHCLDLRTGEPRWHVNALQQFHVANTDWGMSSSPLIHEHRVIVNIGGPNGNGLIAYEIANGNVAWSTAGLSPPDATLTSFQTGAAALPKEVSGKSVPGYSSPQLSEIAGKTVVLNLDGTALRSHDPETGDMLWSVPFENQPHVNVAQPIVFPDGRVLISASYDVGSKMLQVTFEEGRWEVKELWANRNLRCKFTSPVLVDGYLYGLDEGILVCLDPEDGKRLWKGSQTGLKGRYGHGQLLATGPLILALTEPGEVVLIQADPSQLRELDTFRVLPVGKNWNPLTLCRGRLYVRNVSEMACFDVSDRTSRLDEPLK